MGFHVVSTLSSWLGPAQAPSVRGGLQGVYVFRVVEGEGGGGKGVGSTCVGTLASSSVIEVHAPPWRSHHCCHFGALRGCLGCRCSVPPPALVPADGVSDGAERQ